jgi:hypothetical protein
MNNEQGKAKTANFAPKQAFLALFWLLSRGEWPIRHGG